MDIAETPTSLSIERLTSAWANNSIKPNPEYQRGSTWKLRQRQLLVDSVLRGYPLPRFYFHSRTSTDVLGRAQITLEVIDGQQRLIALSQFRQNMWPLFSVDDERIPLPASIRRQPVEWSGKTFDALPQSMQERLLEIKLSVVLIETVTGDEVRDLFIRLQSGTPLTAQQVRDAWPGNVGPFIERLAGKGQRQGQFHRLFSAVDRRGTGGKGEDDYEDPALDARQTCAQLLLLLISKERGKSYPSLRSSALNDLYHQETDFEAGERTGSFFVQLLADTETVILRRPETQGRKTVRKNRVFSLFLFMRFLRFSSVNIPRAIDPIAELFWTDESPEYEPVGRIASAETLEKHFIWFTEKRLASLHLPELDRIRLFSTEQKHQLWLKYDGKCGICDQDVNEQYVEYDHIKPWILGGRTDLDNGRPVHPACHPRGLAAVDGRETPIG